MTAPDRTQQLLQRQAALLRRSAELRGGLAAGMHALETPLARADVLWGWMQALRARRQELALGVAGVAVLLVLRRPRTALLAGWRWGRRSFKLWRTWRRLGPWLRPVLARWL